MQEKFSRERSVCLNVFYSQTDDCYDNMYSQIVFSIGGFVSESLVYWKNNIFPVTIHMESS